MKKIIECVPNFSEGRDLAKVEKIVDSFRGKADVKLLDYSSDADHNRSVVTVVGEPQALKKAIIEAVGVAIDLIDLRAHKGEHPRMGACDVIPYIPIKDVSMEEAVELAKATGEEISRKYKIPIYLYEKAASSKDRENLAVVRKGEFEGFSEKIKKSSWKPDFGPGEVHESAGCIAVGARMPLVAYNVNLNTPDVSIASAIAKKVRFLGGGLRFCKAIGLEMKERGITQVSMNLTDYSKTSIYQAVEMIRFEAKRYGVSIIGTELIGLTPMEALVDCAVYYLGIEDFSYDQILEKRLME